MSDTTHWVGTWTAAPAPAEGAEEPHEFVAGFGVSAVRPIR